MLIISKSYFKNFVLTDVIIEKMFCLTFLSLYQNEIIYSNDKSGDVNSMS